MSKKPRRSTGREIKAGSPFPSFGMNSVDKKNHPSQEGECLEDLSGVVWRKGKGRESGEVRATCALCIGMGMGGERWNKRERERGEAERGGEAVVSRNSKQGRRKAGHSTHPVLWTSGVRIL